MIIIFRIHATRGIDDNQQETKRANVNFYLYAMITKYNILGETRLDVF